MSTSVFAVAAGFASTPASAIFIVDFPSNETNAGSTIDGSDRLTITTDGSIKPSSGNTAVFSTGGNNEITNKGEIATQGSADGILNLYSPQSPITNSGSIHTAGDAASGINNVASVYSAVNNSGSINTVGDSGNGIQNWASFSSPITNSGSIKTAGDDAVGLLNSFSPNSPVTNSGSIRTRGSNAYGIFSLSANSPVTNTGLVISERSDSIWIDAAEGVLNLSVPGYLGGKINFVQPTTVNIRTGKSHSVLWNLSTGSMVGGDPASISGPVPWFYNTNTKQFATYDPSGLAGAVNELGDLTSLLSRVGRNGLAQGCGVAGVTFGADISPEAPAETVACAGQSLWIAGFGGSLDHDGDAITFDRDITQMGVAAGFSGAYGSGLQLGVMGGYVQSEVKVDDSRFADTGSTESYGWFLGFNGQQALGVFAVDFGVTGGWLSHDGSRFVNDNLALKNGLTLGESWADSSYDSWFASPEIGVSVDFDQGNGWIITPSARLRYAMQSIDGFTETGSNADAEVSSRDLGMLEASAELAAMRKLDFGTITGRIGYLSRTSTGDEGVSMKLIGIDNTIPFGDIDSKAAYVGLAAEINISANTSLQLDGTGYFGDGFTGYQGTASISTKF